MFSLDTVNKSDISYLKTSQAFKHSDPLELSWQPTLSWLAAL